MDGSSLFACISRSGFVLASLALLAAPAAAATVYKWTDAQGRVHYSESPPDTGAQTLDIRVPSLSGPPDVSSVEGAGAGGKVVLYTTKWCGVCRRAKAYLSQRGVAYTEFDIESDSAARQRFKALGGSGVPLIMVGDRRMRGFSAERLEAVLQNAGY